MNVMSNTINFNRMMTMICFANRKKQNQKLRLIVLDLACQIAFTIVLIRFFFWEGEVKYLITDNNFYSSFGHLLYMVIAYVWRINSNFR